MTDEAVISRIRKLMALTADRGASEAEAALAAEHVQRLLAEHNLSMASIEASGASSGEGGRRAREGVQRRQVYKWQRNLMSALAELNYCKAFAKFERRFNDANNSSSKVFDGYDLIGRVDNVATTRVMFEYLIETIERLARDDVGNDPTQFFTRYAHSFKEGCADRVVERMTVQRDEMVAAAQRKADEDKARSRHPGAAPSNLPAVILGDMIQNEKDLNYDFECGLAPGTTARNRAARAAENEVYKRETKAKFDAAIAAGHSGNVAYFISCGYDLGTARSLAEPSCEKPETEAQKRRRQEREDRQQERWREQRWNEQQREARRLDPRGYRKGTEAGDDVSLNRQVKDGKGRGRIS